MDNSSSAECVRFECLRLANEMLRFGIMLTPEEIVALAKAYEEFVQGNALPPGKGYVTPEVSAD